MSPKILHVTRLYLPSTGGSETYIRGLLPHLVRAGYACDVLTLDRYLYDGSVVWPAEEILDGIRVRRIGFRGPRQWPFAPRAAAIAREYDLVHIHGTDSLLDILAWSRWWHRRPLVLNTHGGVFHIQRRWWLKMLYRRTWLRASLAHFDMVIADGESDRALFEPVSPRCVVIPPGVDAGAWAGVAHAPERGRLLALSRLQSSKRIDLMIDLVARLAPAHPGLKLSIVGPDTHGIGPDLLRHAAARGVSDRVTLEGKVSDERVRELFARTFVMLSASDYEGWGVAACEALAAGVPCLLNRIPTYETIAAAGTGAVLTDFKDTAAAAAALAALLVEDDAAHQERSRAARANVAPFTIEHAARETARVYDEILQR